MFLIIDASSKEPFLALVRDEVIDVEYPDSSHSLSKTLYPSLNALMKRNHLTFQNGFSEIKKVIYGRGPGSFLGTRTAANLASALRCSLKIEVGSFESPLAFLPFSKGKFAYVMQPKGGKIPVLSGIKNGFETEITATNLYGDLREFFTAETSIEADPKYLVFSSAFKKELERIAIPSHFFLCERKVDLEFLPTLAKMASMRGDADPASLESNLFSLVY